MQRARETDISEANKLMNYFVIGLPRSRTAWLSVFLSQSGVYCHHEGLNGCRNIKEYQKKINTNGDSSTGLMMFDIKKMYPDAPIVIIEKSNEELQSCIDWCRRTYGIKSAAHIFRLSELLSRVNGLRIKQSEISERLPDIWAHLIGTKWKEEYANIDNINIQCDPYNIDLKAATELFSEAIQ